MTASPARYLVTDASGLQPNANQPAAGKPPMPDGDILYGLRAIARVYGISPLAAKKRAAAGQIPVFKFGRTVCARRSTIAADIATREQAGRS